MRRRRDRRILLLAMYPLDRGLWGATTRITQLRAELEARVPLDVVSGTRGERGLRLLRVAFAGRLRGIRGIYVESSSTLPGPADLAFLALARALRIPVLTYLRDAQYLFPEYYAASSPKRWLARAAFLPTVRLLMALSRRVAFPSRGLARAIHGDDREALLLPPGARLADAPALDPRSPGLLFVGNLRYPAHGGDILLEAVRLARDDGHDVRLVCVLPPGADAPVEADWLRVARADGPEIDRLLPDVRATITPRRKTPYNDLAVPIKVLEYLGYARPLIVTDTEETTAIVGRANAGVVVEDSVEGLRRGIGQVWSADAERLQAWAANARATAEANTWGARAERILELLRSDSELPAAHDLPQRAQDDPHVEAE
jgi:glycosyltransferase involved in cell wall biosynthesis